jgi:hypothetical protein
VRRDGPKKHECSPSADEPTDALAAALKVPEGDVLRQQRRFGALRRKAQSESVVSMVIGTLLGSPAAFFVLPKFAMTWLNILVSIVCGAVLGYAVNRAIRFFRPGGLDAPAAEFRLREGRTLDEYAQLLDEFGIELAVPRPLNRTIEYTSGFTLPQPETRSGAFGDERRLVVGFRHEEVQPHDRELLRRAGAPFSPDDLLLVCFPADLERRLLRLEREYALGDLSRVSKTVFGVRNVRGGNQFYIIDQTCGMPAMGGSPGVFDGRA